MLVNGDKMKVKKIKKLLKLSYEARKAVESFFWFETMDTFGKYYLKLATEKYKKEEKKKANYFDEAKKYYKQAYEYKQHIGQLNCVEDDFNPFIGTSNAFLGILYAKKGDYLESYNYHKKGVEIRINMYGEAHPYVIKCYGEIFKIYDKALSNLSDKTQQLNLACLCFDYAVRCIIAKSKADFLEGEDVLYYVQFADKSYKDINDLIDGGAKYDNNWLKLIKQQYKDIITTYDIKKAS